MKTQKSQFQKVLADASTARPFIPKAVELRNETEKDARTTHPLPCTVRKGLVSGGATLLDGLSPKLRSRAWLSGISATGHAARILLLNGALIFAALTGIPAKAQVSGPMDLWPRNTSVELGGSKQFGAYVPISPNTILWLVNDIPGGDANVGTISTNGLYKPPTQAPMNSVGTVKAQSTAYPSSFASTSLTITALSVALGRVAF